MVYVYSRNIKSGRSKYIGIYETESDAIQQIARCYQIDARLSQIGETYYFMKTR